MAGQISDTMRCFESNNRELKEENEELEEEIEKMKLASVEVTVPTDSRVSWVSWYHPQQPELYDSVLNS